MDVPAEVTQEESHTGFLIHFPSAVLALTFLARRTQPFLSLADREFEFCVLTNLSFSTCWARIYIYIFGYEPVSDADVVYCSTPAYVFPARSSSAPVPHDTFSSFMPQQGIVGAAKERERRALQSTPPRGACPGDTMVYQ